MNVSFHRASGGPIPGPPYGRLSIAAVAFVICCSSSASVATDQRAATPIATLPFELATRHIVVQGTINNSGPLAFVLDTGAAAVVVRLDTAERLGLTLDGSVSAGGAGEGRQAGRFVKDASWRLAGVDKAVPVRLALPFAELPAALGREIDGIVGGEFIRNYVLQIDYQSRELTLHDPARFQYRGAGQILPLDFDQNNHPVLTATVTPPGRPAIDGRFLLDLGSSGALILHSPFNRQHDLLATQSATVPLVGASGAGGRTSGRIGRVESLTIGRFTLDRPFTMFSEDKAGAFANAALAGNIGAQIASRFRIFLDYGRRRIILEPAPSFGDPFERAFSGMALRAGGAGYRTFRVHEAAAASPAAEAGIQAGDVIVSVNGTAAEALTLSMLQEMFERRGTYELVLRRESQTLTVTLRTVTG